MCWPARLWCSKSRSGHVSKRRPLSLHRLQLGKRRPMASTGFGKLASKRIPPGQTALLQRNLIVSHCCGVGAPTPEAIVRLMMALKIISLGRGASGVRREVIEQLEAMLARGIYPLVPQQGSVGASGDLSPLA